MDSPFLFPPGWCKRHGQQLQTPPGYDTANKPFKWTEYVASVGGALAPEACFPPQPTVKRKKY